MTRRVPRASKHTRLISDRLFDVFRAIQTWSLEDLRAVDRDLLDLTGSNCCWFTFRHRESIRELVHSAIKEKEDEARRAAKILGSNLEK